jgi:8-oxo-dGTP pyrophosphatase MutT (NUDIX family)
MSSYNKTSRPVKESFGIILCKYQENKPLQVLVVKKRYTYSYAEFVHGHYSSRDLKKVYALLETMTPDELIDVWSLNFQQMWYRIWLTYNKTSHYNKKYKKFYNVFLKDDNGKKLRQMIESVKVFGGLYYEFPKGKRLTDIPNNCLTKQENPLSCAMRELQEETNIDRKYYKVINGFIRVYSYIHMGVKYVNTYYLAIAKSNLIQKNINYICNDLTNGEVVQAQWMTFNEVRLIDNPNGMLQKLLKPSFSMIKNYIKGKTSLNIPYNFASTHILSQAKFEGTNIEEDVSCRSNRSKCRSEW